MFVSCGHCHAEYELDDAKIPAGGARLRCTKCSHSFVVTPPEASDIRSADDLAHDTLTAEARRRADQSLGLAAAPDPGFESDLRADPVPEEEAAPEEEFDPDGEADWEFNEEINVPEPKPSRGAPESPFDQGDDWSELSLAEDVVDDLLGSDGPVEADAAAAVDDLLGEIDTIDSNWGDSEDELTSESDLPSERPDVSDAPALDVPSKSPAADAGDSLDDLSDWDLFDQPAESDGSALPTGPQGRSAAAARGGARAEPRVEIAVAMAGDSTPAVRWTDRVSAIAGWGAVSALMILALVGGLASNSSDASATLGSWSGAGFEADQIVGRWVENAVAGSLYVVSGRIRRAPGSDRDSQNSVGIRLIDTKGRGIDQPAIPLAPAVPERILRESSPAELEAFQLRRAGRIAAVGERWIFFEAVVADLPRFAGRFELQVLDR